MIRVRRPTAEPAPLAKQRARGLKRALKALNQHGAGSRELLDTLHDYDGGKDVIFLAQHKKCAFCERRARITANSLEHFRPKAEVWRHLPKGQPQLSTPGYWWLTWTWSNHLFSCHSCNSGFKKNYFPLAGGSSVLPGPTAPYPHKALDPSHENTAVESTLLIDPSIDDPLDHIEWRPVDASKPRNLWQWTAWPLTPRGDVTIQVLDLVGQAADIVAPHLRDHVLPHTETICMLVDQGQHGLAQAAWNRLAADVTRSDCELAGPTWSALQHLVDAPRRTVAGLVMPTRP